MDRELLQKQIIEFIKYHDNIITIQDIRLMFMEHRTQANGVFCELIRKGKIIQNCTIEYADGTKAKGWQLVEN